jgi:uncharacterized protein YneF (UPF0154 family)
MKIIALLILTCTFSFGFGSGYVFNEFLNYKIIHKPVNETPPVVSEKKQVFWF